MENPPFLPLELSELSAECLSCGARLRPNFWTASEEPFLPIYPAGTKGEKGAWQQVSTTIKCHCGGSANIPIETTRLGHPVFFFGDDADRPLGNWFLHSFSMIGGTSGPIADLSEQVCRLKERFVTDRPAEDWIIHTTKILSGQQRLTHPVYKKFDRTSAWEFFKECAQIIHNNDKYTWNTYIMGIVRGGSDKKERKNLRKEVKTISNQAILSYQIYHATKMKLRPVFTFDASKPLRNFPHIEGWSRDSYLGSRKFLANAFLSHGNDIPEPEFVQPGSHPCLELADVHAYFAARSVFLRSQNNEPEIPLSDFGQFRYLTVRHDAKFEYFVGDEIPRKWFS